MEKNNKLLLNKDILAHQFKAAGEQGGYDPEDVEYFRSKVSESYVYVARHGQENFKKVEALEAKVKELQAQVTAYKGDESTISQAMLTLEKMKQESEANSKAEHERLVEEGRVKANELIARGQEQANDIRVSAEAEANEWLKDQSEKMSNALEHTKKKAHAIMTQAEEHAANIVNEAIADNAKLTNENERILAVAKDLHTSVFNITGLVNDLGTSAELDAISNSIKRNQNDEALRQDEAKEYIEGVKEVSEQGKGEIDEKVEVDPVQVTNIETAPKGEVAQPAYLLNTGEYLGEDLTNYGEGGEGEEDEEDEDDDEFVTETDESFITSTDKYILADTKTTRER